jgi:chemotaxis protein CheC
LAEIEELEQIDSTRFDVLKELGNIGAGNATTALSQMINTKVDMSVPRVELLEFKELPDIVGGAETIVSGILLMLEGDIDGMMMFMLDKSSARHLVSMLLGTDMPESDEFSELEISALKEIGNIITGAYLSSLSSLIGLKIVSSVPYLSIDMAGAILSVPAIEFGKVGDKALLIQSQFGEIAENSINGFFIMIPTVESYSKIMKALGM